MTDANEVKVARLQRLLDISDENVTLLTDQLLAKGRQLPALMAGQWQPIESAPKDGRIIIGWSAGWESSTAIYWVDGLDVPADGEWDWSGTIQCPPSHDPTHWMPLPAPPTGEG